MATVKTFNIPFRIEITGNRGNVFNVRANIQRARAWWALIKMAFRVLLMTALLFAMPALAARPEVLVLASAAVQVTGLLTTRHGAFIQNNGPNDIWCGVRVGDAVVDKSFRVAASGGTWTFNSPLEVWCRAKTADQVTGAATTVIEVP